MRSSSRKRNLVANNGMVVFQHPSFAQNLLSICLKNGTGANLNGHMCRFLQWKMRL